jgi:hypothetical protein
VEKVKVDPVFLDRGMQPHRHIRISKMEIAFPEGSAGHDESSTAFWRQADYRLLQVAIKISIVQNRFKAKRCNQPVSLLSARPRLV